MDRFTTAKFEYMIHTLELIQEIPHHLVEEIFSGFCFPQYKIDQFYRSQKKISGCFHKLSSQYPQIGIKRITVIRQQDTIAAGSSYYCILRVEPQMLLHGERSINLFMATPENIQELSNQFHSTMNLFVDDSIQDIVNLSVWKCRRIDYTANLQFKDDEEAKLFLELTKKTSRYTRTKKLINRNITAKEQSTAEVNGSAKTIFYDKKKQIEETYGGVPEADLQRLAHQANGIIRFEIQCKKQKVISLKKQYNLPSRNILGFLNEDIATDVLKKKYEQAVGLGDFYSFYHAQKRINSSSFRTKKKTDLVNFLRLIAQTRHIDAAMEQFVAGGTRIKRTNVVVEGSRNTFYNRLKDIISLDINPVLIPKERKITFLRNPMK